MKFLKIGLRTHFLSSAPPKISSAFKCDDLSWRQLKKPENSLEWKDGARGLRYKRIVSISISIHVDIDIRVNIDIRIVTIRNINIYLP